MKTLAFVLVGLLMAGTFVYAQPIFDYVNRPDASYGWEKTDETVLAGGGFVTHLKMTSQVWRDITWTHRMQIITPPGMQYPQTALLVITGGTVNANELSQIATIAGLISAPIAVLGDIPNQPLFDGLQEDALIAFTFQNCLDTGDTTWPLLFPMTKAAVRAMDAVEQYTQRDWDTPVDSFVVTGASKRGWTTWFTGVVAPERIKGIAPMVYDNLNLAAQMRHQVATWGDYSAMIHDYTELDLPDLITTDEGSWLTSMVDPYTYRARAVMPKLSIMGTNDPYWPLDAASQYSADMPSPNYLLYVPNSGHGLDDFMRAIMGQAGFFAACTGRADMPDLQWTYEHGRHLRLHVTSDLQPVQVLQWTASAPTRDFRSAEWSSIELQPVRGGYLARMQYPAEGYRAIFVEANYDIEGRNMPLSTGVTIVGPRD
jgi:PhoPQ-activated pathogenicity-related protein